MRYLARTIFLPVGIFSANLHVFVVFSPPLHLRLLELCLQMLRIFCLRLYFFRYLVRTIFLPAGIFSANLHAFVPKIFPLDAITPESKNWTAKVSILNKTEPRTSSQPTSIRFQKLLLADNKCTATIIIDSHPPRTVMAKGK
ncbi:hypothetical protein OROMI_000921 [Orobanche minor]